MTRANGSPSARLRRRTSSTVVGAEHLRAPRGGAVTKPKSRIAPLGAHARLGQLRLDRAEPAERLAQRVDGREPAEALAGVDQPLVAQELERLADRDPAGRRSAADSSASLGRSRPAANSPAATRRAQVVGDRLVADLAHLSYTCMLTPDDARGSRHGHRPRSPPPPPSSWSRRSTAASPSGSALGRDRLGRGPHAGREDPRQPPPRRRARSSSGAAATPTSTPTASPCRTPPPRWRCSSS